MSRPKTAWFIFWMVWLASFLGAEAFAIFGCNGGCTLSESVWWLEGQWPPLIFLLAGLLIWLFDHFVLSRWRKRK